MKSQDEEQKKQKPTIILYGIGWLVVYSRIEECTHNTHTLRENKTGNVEEDDQPTDRLTSPRNETRKGFVTIKINLCSCINIWVSLPFSYFFFCYPEFWLGLAWLFGAAIYFANESTLSSLFGIVLSACIAFPLHSSIEWCCVPFISMYCSKFCQYQPSKDFLFTNMCMCILCMYVCFLSLAFRQ